ncbi:MAG: glycerol acyltransferase [Hellea sp.]|nr:glycerol acyltransferase [Hellea sp.]
MAKFDNEHVSENTPRMGNAFTRWLGSAILKMIGWKVVGQLPNEKKAIIVGMPHTSNWDLIIAMSSMLHVGLKFNWVMKKEAFFWPLGPLWKSMGGIPINRSKKSNITDQIADWFNENDNVWLGITPEGTRSKVKSYKRGYLRMAYAANVPIFLAGINGPTKEVILDKVLDVTGDLDKDNAAIKAYVDATFVGIRPKNM